MRRSFRTRVSFSGGFPGLAPWAGMRCPVRAWDWTRGWGLVSETWWGPTVSERLSFHLPQRGNAYQPRASPWETNPRESVCSEGTPHREGRGRGLSSATYAAFLQNAGFFFGWVPRVGTLGWYAMPLQGMGSDGWWRSGIGNTVGAHGNGNATVPFALVGQCLLAKGNALGTTSKRIRVF